jgi:hypothetical protein
MAKASPRAAKSSIWPSNLALLQKTGNWYMSSGDKIGNGREAAKAYVVSHPDLEKELEDKLHALLKNAPTGDAAEPKADAETGEIAADADSDKDN